MAKKKKTALPEGVTESENVFDKQSVAFEHNVPVTAMIGGEKVEIGKAFVLVQEGGIGADIQLHMSDEMKHSLFGETALTGISFDTVNTPVFGDLETKLEEKPKNILNAQGFPTTHDDGQWPRRDAAE